MFEAFSGGYYLGRLYVEPGARSDAVILEEQFRTIGEQLHDEGWSGAPLIMRYEKRHFEVRGEQGVPEDTLVLPEECLEHSDADRRQVVLLAKPDVEPQLHPFVDQVEATGPNLPSDPFVPDAIRRTNGPT